MISINESTITDKGLNYIRSLNSFYIMGNHYYPYPEILKRLSDEFTLKTEYFGTSDQGSTKTVFTKKESDVIIKDKMQQKINQFAELNGINIEVWTFKK